MPANTVKVDRSTRWGNPIRVRPGYTAAQAVADYRLWIAGLPMSPLAPLVPAAPAIEEIRRCLMNKNLACWCVVGQPCHADVLLELANLSVPRLKDRAGPDTR